LTSAVDITDQPVLRMRDTSTVPQGAPLFGVAGSPGTRLLAGPAQSMGSESLASHMRRLGSLDAICTTPQALRDTVRASGLMGRGGAGFPTATKFDLAAAAVGTPIVVVNASEGEPASAKDRTLLELRPHLILDGADLAAAAVGAKEIVIYFHRAHLRSNAALELALAERRDAGIDTSNVRLVDAPARYVAGETSAVVSYLGGNGALPRRGAKPAAQVGIANRPTVVNNAETLAHLALVARFGANWFAQVGTPEAPGSTLITLAGSVAVPGQVVEVLGPVAIGRVLESAGGLDAVPRAILLGGYAGTWISGETAWHTPLDRHALKALGVSLGCGLVAVLHDQVCGLAETARLLAWLAGESSGQCGSCVFGLPLLSGYVDDIVAGRSRRSDVRRLREHAASVRGRGACGHPTGVVTLLESALETFTPELARHLRGAVCDAQDGLDHFPLPSDAKLRR
jgi:NADH:ubiquinone oxidoreductase subunit F (NADH-binding)